MLPQFLWLGLLALLIPIVIHLFSQSRPRLIRFSLVGLIKPDKVQHMTQLRLTERRLLILRLVLLFLAALLLAQLTWLSGPDSQKTHIIVTQDWLAHASTAQKHAVIDKMSTAKLIYLDAGDPFKIQTLTAQQLLTYEASVDLAQAGNNLWLGLYNYAQKLKQNSEIVVYSTDRFKQFSGQRLPIVQALNWHILPVVSDPIAIMTLRAIVLYDPQQLTSMAYLRGAFDALAHQASWAVDVDYFLQGAQATDHQALAKVDWVLYLSDQPLNAVLLDYVHQGGKIFITAARADHVGLWLSQKNDIAASFTLTQLGTPALPPHLMATRAVDSLWLTQDGQSLLNQYDLDQGQILAWHSRFDPKWNNLVTQLDFPFILNGLLNNSEAKQVQLANERLSKEQIIYEDRHLSQGSPSSLAKLQVTEKNLDFSHLLIFLLVIVFCTERLVSQHSSVKAAEKHPVGAE